MNMHQVVHPRSSSNGYDRRKVGRDNLSRSDSKFQAVKTNSSRTTFGKVGELESSSRDRLMYLTSCLIGHQVDVHLLDGSVYSGIFHAKNSEDLGIVLKMAHLIKDGSGGQKNTSEPPARTLVVLLEDLAQVIAQGVPVTRDELTNELWHEKQQELMTDSSISQPRHVEVGRELEPWIPDANDPGCPELEKTFDAPWNRGWDQFEANATLFGVRSTFREELYTTELQRGPHMRELERKAELIAREIVSEDTRDVHLAEERGIQIEGNHEIDEETRFSSVYRGVDDSGYNEIEDTSMDSQNDETFGSISSSIDKPPVDMSTCKTSDGTQVSLKGVVQSYPNSMKTDVHSGAEDYVRLPITEQNPKPSSVTERSRVSANQLSGHSEMTSPKEDKENQQMLDQSQTSTAEDSETTMGSKKESSDKIALSPNATAFDPSHESNKKQEKVSTSNELSESAIPPKAQGTTSSVVRPSSSASTASDRGGVTSTSTGRGLSSSSSSGSLSSEKSTLNPHAKEFKLNPNAKSFIPSQTSFRPSSPAPDSPFYYPTNMPSMTQMHGMPVGMGPVIFNPHAPPMPQPYYHPNGPQYGQQMIIGQSRPFIYMPPYPAEMPYKGREY